MPILRRQLDAFAVSIDEQSLAALTPEELTDVLDLGVTLHRGLRNLHHRYGPIVQPGQPAFDYAVAKQLENLYLIWDCAGRAIWQQVKLHRQRGREIDPANSFKDAYVDVGSVIAVGLDHILESMRQLRDDKRIPHSEVVNAFRRRVGA